MVRTQLLQPLAHKFGMSTELLQIANGKITSYDGVLSTTVTEAMDGKELWATAQCRPHPTEPLDESGQGDAFVGLAFCAVRAVVDVDIELGSIRVVEMAVAQDVGRVLNPSQLATRIGRHHPGHRHGTDRKPPHGPRSDPPPRPNGLRTADIA